MKLNLTVVLCLSFSFASNFGFAEFEEPAGPPPTDRGEIVGSIELNRNPASFLGDKNAKLAPWRKEGQGDGFVFKKLTNRSPLYKVGLRKGDVLNAIWSGRALPEKGSKCAKLFSVVRDKNLVFRFDYPRPVGECCGGGWSEVSPTKGYEQYVEPKCD